MNLEVAHPTISLGGLDASMAEKTLDGNQISIATLSCIAMKNKKSVLLVGQFYLCFMIIPYTVRLMGMGYIAGKKAGSR